MKSLTLFVITGASTLLAQSAVKGTYVLEEKGATRSAAFQIAGSLNLDGQGRLTGVEFIKNLGGVRSLAVTGNYSLDAGGNGSLAIQNRVDDPQEESGFRLETANYHVVSWFALRTDADVLSTAEITAVTAPATALKGTFAVTEEGVTQFGQSYLSIGNWIFDGHGAVTATILSRSFGAPVTTVFTGRLDPQSDGSINVVLTGPSPEAVESQEPVPAPTLSYKLIATGRSFEALRTDPGVLSETAVKAQ